MKGLCGVLALQGSFEKHAAIVEELGVCTREVRDPEDFRELTHLILPGGESTTLFLLSRKYGILDPLKRYIERGMPVMGTCAGAILLGSGPPPPPRLSAAPVEVIRNAYGRQRESFSADISLSFCDKKNSFTGIFIRAPRFSLSASCRKDAGIEVLGTLGEEPVLIRYRRMLLASFHPELTNEPDVHRYFLLQLSVRKDFIFQ